MKSFLLSFLLLFSLNAESLEITYDKDFWRQMDMFGFGVGLPFEKSFICGKSYSFNSNVSFCEYICKDTYCDVKCKYPETKEAGAYELNIEECTPESAVINGSNGYSTTVNRKEYEAARNNWFLIFLKSIGKFAQTIDNIKLDYGTPDTAYEEINGQKQQIRAFKIIGSMQSGTAKNRMGFELWVSNNYEGPAQVLFFGTAHDDFFLKMKGLKWR